MTDGLGVCHLCPSPKPIKDVLYCPQCEHYFCEGCRGRWFERGIEFVKERVGGKRPGCCLLMKAAS